MTLRTQGVSAARASGRPVPESWEEGGFDTLNENHGEDSGNFTLSASSITVGNTGSIVTDGGNAVFHEFGFPSQFIGAAPGNGGTITLTSITGVGITGTLSTQGGNARSSFAHCFTGGDGGAVIIGYATTVESANASFDVSWGDGYPAFDCDDTPGHRGDILDDYSGVPNPTDIVQAGEHEPNHRLAEAQPLFAPVEISATIAPADAGDLGTADFDIEDLYALGLRRDLAVNVNVVSSSNAVNLDLFIIEPATLHIVASSFTTASSESITALSLTAGTYLIGVSQFGDTPAEENAYTLTVIPTVQ